MNRIYVASSWRNAHQAGIVQLLRTIPDCEVYDFREPVPGNNGFHWSQIEPDWRSMTVPRFREVLDSELAVTSYRHDMGALNQCKLCVLVMPCGRSAHLELGFARGAGKKTAVFYPPGVEIDPELMYKMCHLITGDEDELVAWVKDSLVTP